MEINVKKCSEHCRRCENETKCLLCSNGYYGDNCKENNSYIQDKVLMCNESFISNGKECISCSDNCIKCNIEQCEICFESEYESGNC